MAERKAKSQLIGDGLRDVAVLMLVFYPIDSGLQDKFDWPTFEWVMGFAVALFIFGLILEGRDEI